MWREVVDVCKKDGDDVFSPSQFSRDEIISQILTAHPPRCENSLLATQTRDRVKDPLLEDKKKKLSVSS